MRSPFKYAIDPPAHAARTAKSVRVLHTVYAVALGGTLGAFVASFWGLGIFGFITGIMLGFAVRTAWVLMNADDGPDEFSDGNARTEEEVRQALAEIKGREK